jgi:hypothetical protein
MTKRVASTLGLLLVVLTGCGLQSKTPESGTSGSGGSAGGGSGGSGGASGIGGASGVGGSAGNAGSGGNAGTSGIGGSGGNAGNAGMSGGASGVGARDAGAITDGGQADANPGECQLEGCPCKPQPGLPCVPEPIPHPEGLLVCREGIRYCRDGFLTACEPLGEYVLIRN